MKVPSLGAEFVSADSVDEDPLTGPGRTAIINGCESATPAAEAVTIFGSALVEDSVPVVAPEGSVAMAGCSNWFLSPEAEKTTLTPGMASPHASRMIAVRDMARPAGVPLAVETKLLLAGSGKRGRHAP
jgi:hypothetical protein